MKESDSFFEFAANKNRPDLGQGGNFYAFSRSGLDFVFEGAGKNVSLFC